MKWKRPLRPDELYHYGRLGMKWGQRIYSNNKSSSKHANNKIVDKKSSKKKLITIGKKFVKWIFTEPEGYDSWQYWDQMWWH